MNTNESNLLEQLNDISPYDEKFSMDVLGAHLTIAPVRIAEIFRKHAIKTSKTLTHYLALLQKDFEDTHNIREMGVLIKSQKRYYCAIHLHWIDPKYVFEDIGEMRSLNNLDSYLMELLRFYERYR